MRLDRKFWSEERNLSSLLALLVIYHVAVPMAAVYDVGSILAALCVSLIAVYGLLSTYRRWFFRISVRIVAIAAILGSWWDVLAPGGLAAIPSTVVDAALYTFLAIGVVAKVFGPGPVSAHRIRGAIVVYLLIGTLFGFVYMIVMAFDHGAFRLSSELVAQDLELLRQELSYYSFVTLTTVGYGDITPVSQIARSLATLEAVTGQLYIAITLARLVSSQATAAARD